jgi:hypothetical protein
VYTDIVDHTSAKKKQMYLVMHLIGAPLQCTHFDDKATVHSCQYRMLAEC